MDIESIKEEILRARVEYACDTAYVTKTHILCQVPV